MNKSWRRLVSVYLGAVFSIGAFFAHSVHADLLIRITEGADQAMPIAVVPFIENGTMPPGENISSIVRNDLAMSGQFKSLSPEKMLSLPSTEKQVFYRDWRVLNQRYLLIGEVNREGDKIRVRYELSDVNAERRLIGKSAEAPVNSFRNLAHHISDDVFETITGVPGDFSTKLAYVTRQMANGRPLYRLQVSDIDGKRSSIRLEGEEPILSPAWSPDGKSLAYVSFETGKPAIYIHELTTGQRSKVADFPGLNSAPDWSADGKSLLMTLSKDGNAEIYSMDIGSGKLRRLTDHWGIDTEANWGVNGEIVFTSDRSGGPQIYRLGNESSQPQRLTFGSRYNARPRVSPDGRYLFYVHQRDGDFHIARLDRATGQEVVLTNSDLDESPTISPNGQRLAYSTKKNGKSVLAVVATDGTELYTLPASEGDVREPAWSPRQ